MGIPFSRSKMKGYEAAQMALTGWFSLFHPHYEPFAPWMKAQENAADIRRRLRDARDKAETASKAAAGWEERAKQYYEEADRWAKEAEATYADVGSVKF